MRRLTLLLVALLVLSGCSIGRDDPTPTPTPASPTPTAEATATTAPEPTSTDVPPDPTSTSTPQPAPTTPPPPPAPTATDVPPTQTTEPTATDEPEETGNEIEAQIRLIAEQTAAIRGLAILEELNIQLVSSEEIAANLTELFEESYSPEEAEIDRDLLWILRLIDDRGLDYWELQVSLRQGLVLGYYRWDTGELVIRSDSERLTPGARITTAHEVAHALQDQHFGLDRWDDDDTDWEKMVGFRALVEGEASFVEVEWALTHLTTAEILEYIASFDDMDSSVYDDVPRFVLDTLFFAYEAGYVFVEALYDHGGWDAIDAALIDPPVSSEQIMHPEKYINEPRDMPLPVDMPDVISVLGDSWHLAIEGTLGELDLLILLEENGMNDASEAAAGWGGTVIEMYQSGDDLFSVLATRWDTEEDAAEFQAALRSTMNTYFQINNYWTGAGRHHAIVASGDAVTLFSTTDLNMLLAVLAAQ